MVNSDLFIGRRAKLLYNTLLITLNLFIYLRYLHWRLDQIISGNSMKEVIPACHTWFPDVKNTKE